MRIIEDSGSPDGYDRRLVVKTISSMEELPMPSPRMTKMFSLLRSSADKDRLARAIARSPALSKRIIDSINEEKYADASVSNINEAANVLGILNLKHIIYSTSLMGIFSYSDKAEWEHSYSSSILAANIIDKNKIPVSSKLPFIMLLHDIGKLVLKKINIRKYNQIIESARINKIPLHKAEEGVFQVNHAIAGGILLKKWGLPDDIIVPVTHHHSDFAPGKEYIFDTAMVQLCDWIDNSARQLPVYPPSDAMIRYAGLDGIDVDYWLRYQKAVISVLINNSSREVSNPGQWLNFRNIFIPLGLPERYQAMNRRRRQQERAEAGSATSARRPVKNIIKERLSDTSTHKFKRPVVKPRNTETQVLQRSLKIKIKKEKAPTETRVLKRPLRSKTSETQVIKRPIRRGDV